VSVVQQSASPQGFQELQDIARGSGHTSSAGWKRRRIQKPNGREGHRSFEEIHVIVVSHASRLGLAIGIVHHEPTGIDDRKARVLHVERVQNQFGNCLREWLQSRLLDHGTEHIYRHGVTPSSAGLVAERRGRKSS
jgi:hypothetical protein